MCPCHLQLFLLDTSSQPRPLSKGCCQALWTLTLTEALLPGPDRWLTIWSSLGLLKPPLGTDSDPLGCVSP